MNNYLLGAVAVAVLVLAVAVFYNGPANVVLQTTDGKTVRVVEQLGGSAGPDHYVRQRFHNGFEYGSAGTFFATTSSASATFTTGNLTGVDYVEVTPTVAAVTLTLPATTTAGFDNIVGTETGSTHVIDFYNASTTGAATITFAAGAGIDLQEDEGETVTLDVLETARLTLKRKSDSDVLAWLEVAQVGD